MPDKTRMQNKGLFDKYKEGKHWQERDRRNAEFFAHFLKHHEFSGRILDIGCDCGADIDIFSNDWPNAVGIDINKEELEKASEKRGNFLVMDAERLAFLDSSFQAVFAANVAHYLRLNKSISEVRRVLSTGGFFYVLFNLEIIDFQGNVDYKVTQSYLRRILHGFKVLDRHLFVLEEEKPIPHKHKFLQLILQKT